MPVGRGIERNFWWDLNTKLLRLIDVNLKESFLAALQSIVLCVVYSAVAHAQQTQYDKGTPPQHAAGVSPLGSYTSADIGTVNLSNGALNLKFPLGNVGG